MIIKESESNSFKSRDVFLDFTKGILICLVVLGHAIQYGSGIIYLSNDAYYNNLLMKFIYSFHMPLFIFISGWLTYGSFKRNGDMVATLNRAKTLIIPIIVWTPIMRLFGILAGRYSTITLLGLIRTFLTNYWFLWAVIWSTIFAFFTNRIQKRTYRILLYLLFFIVSFFTPDIYWAYAYKFVIPFFIVGFLMAKYNCNYILKGGGTMDYNILCTVAVL